MEWYVVLVYNQCTFLVYCLDTTPLLGSLKKNTTLEYSTRVVQEGDRRCEKSTLNDLAYLTPLRIPLMNPVHVRGKVKCARGSTVADKLACNCRQPFSETLKGWAMAFALSILLVLYSLSSHVRYTDVL